MTRERCKELLPVMEAWANGKEIQAHAARSVDVWNSVIAEHISFDSDFLFRIKPEPKKRPMTRGEVLYMVTTTPGMVVRFMGYDTTYPATVLDSTDDPESWEYSIIDKTGSLVEGWCKFEIEE